MENADKTTETLFCGWRKDFDPMKRIAPAWVWYKCATCGADTAISPAQELKKRQIGGHVCCIFCLVDYGAARLEQTGQMPRVENLGDGDCDQN